MGAGALCALLAQTPLRFERLVFVLPAVLDRPRADGAMGRSVQMAQCVDNLDREGLVALLLEGEPLAVRAQPQVQAWCRDQASTLVGTAVSRALRTLPSEVPLSDRLVLSAVTVPVLVVSQEQDPAHPTWVAEELAASLPDARLEILAPGGLLWRHRGRMRDLIGGFLSPKYPALPRRWD